MGLTQSLMRLLHSFSGSWCAWDLVEVYFYCPQTCEIPEIKPCWSSKRNNYPPAMQEMLVQSLGQEDLQKKEMATHSSTLAWRIPWTEEPGGLQYMGLQKSWTQLSN